MRCYLKRFRGNTIYEMPIVGYENNSARKIVYDSF